MRKKADYLKLFLFIIKEPDLDPEPDLEPDPVKIRPDRNTAYTYT